MEVGQLDLPLQRATTMYASVDDKTELGSINNKTYSLEMI